MNRNERQQQINDTLRDLNWKLGNRSGSHINCIRLNTHNSKLHEVKKTDICYDLQLIEHPYIVEAQLEGYGTPDIIDILNFEVYEIIHSESEDSILNKTKKYPDGLNIRKVYV